MAVTTTIHTGPRSTELNGLDEAIESHPIWTDLRGPDTLMSNAQWWAPTIRESGQVIDATEPGKIGIVNPHDVATVAAIALTQPGHVGHGYFVTGPEALSPNELTSILSDVLGRNLEFVASTPEEEARRSIERGTAPQMAAARQNLDELFALSRAGIITDDVYSLTGNPPRSFRTWAQDHADAFA